MVNDKDIAILIIIRDYILSERERQGLPAPVPSTELSTAARETAIWLASEEDFEDKISDYLRARLVEQNGNANVILFPGLAYGRHIWPADAEASEIAKDLIERIGFSEVVNFPALDQLGISSGFAVLDQSGNPVETSGGQPHEFGYTLVVAYASDGNNMIVDQINERRGRAGAAPLEVSVPLREIARKSIATPIDDVTRASLLEEARSYGYASEGLRVRLDYSGSFAKFPSRDDIPVTEPQMAEIVASQLIRDWPTLLRPDWQDIGIATSVKNHPELGVTLPRY